MAAASPTPDVPLEIEPLVGWRVWKLGRNSLGELRLRAIVHSHEWAPQTVEPAVCAARPYRTDEHDAPSKTCMCGYYAADSVKSLASARVFSNGVAVIGAIAMWGSVIQHARGARSEFAYPARLRLVCMRCLERGAVVDPTVVIGNRDPRPLCTRHARGKNGPRVPADQIQAELLSTYAVELLPQPTLPRLRSPGSNDARDGLAMIVGVLFMVLRGVITAMFMLWLLGLALMVVSVIIGGVVRLVTGSDPSPPTPAVSVVGEPSSAPFVMREWHRAAPHRGTPLPAPVPELTFPCGVGHGDRVELVPCGDRRAELIGLGMQEAPHGMAQDCTPSDVAYSHGRGWWVCWFELRDAWVHPWPDAPNPFHTEGGAPDGDR